MKLYDFEVNPYTYKNFKTEQLKNFQSMLKSNIRNFKDIDNPTLEDMEREYKAEELLPLIKHEIKVRSTDGRDQKRIRSRQ